MHTAQNFAPPRQKMLATSAKVPAAMKMYRNEELLNLTPVEVIHKLYGVAIVAAKKNDLKLSQRAINELIVGLNFEHKEMALGLFRLYDYCKQCLRKGKTDEAVDILEELRTTWAQAFAIVK